MALQAGPVLRAVRNMLRTMVIAQEGFYTLPVTAFGEVAIGARQSASRALVANVLFQANDSRMKVLGEYRWDFTIVVEMYYRTTTADVETAEIMLADAYPAALDMFYNNRALIDPSTGLATVRSSQVTGPSSNPWYESLASAEYRMQVMFLNCWSSAVFNSDQPVP